MSILNYTAKYILFFLIGIVVLGFLSSCSGIWDPGDARKIPANVDERVQKNLEEGKGLIVENADDVKVEVTIASNGKAFITDLIIDGTYLNQSVSD